MIRLDLTERDVELIEVALESAISACTGFESIEGSDLNGLSGEYALALRRVRRGGD